MEPHPQCPARFANDPLYSEATKKIPTNAVLLDQEDKDPYDNDKLILRIEKMPDLMKGEKREVWVNYNCKQTGKHKRGAMTCSTPKRKRKPRGRSVNVKLHSLITKCIVFL